MHTHTQIYIDKGKFKFAKLLHDNQNSNAQKVLDKNLKKKQKQEN